MEYNRVCVILRSGISPSEGATPETNEKIQLIDIPQILRLWIAELTSVGVRVAMKVA